MLVKIKRQSKLGSDPYYQSFSYNGPKHVTVSAVLDALNYTDDLFDIDGNPAERIRWECSCMQAVCGGCAIAVTILLKKILTKKQLWVAGALGAIAHSVGQMAMAITITATPGLIAYLPVMIVVSIITGTFTGLCAQFLVNRGNLWKIIST